MKFRLTTKLNDGKSEAPPIEVPIATPEHLLSIVAEEIWEGDEGLGVPVGSTLLIERIA